MDDYYSADVPLLRILEDIRASLYSGNADKKAMVGPIDKLISEHMERNPFDVLEPSQKDYFENIRIKSGNNYAVVRDDVDKVATELASKNALVNKYLNRSNTSFWISIAALALSILLGLIGMFQNTPSNIRRSIVSALSALNNKDKDVKAGVEEET